MMQNENKLKQKKITYISYHCRCVGGSLQLIPGRRIPAVSPMDTEPSICGQNERYFPPLVLFQDFPQDLARDPDDDDDEPRVASLLFRVDETTTSRSQFLAHFSFTPTDAKDTGVQLRGGTPMETVEDGEEEDDDNEDGQEHGGAKDGVADKMTEEAGRNDAHTSVWG